MENLSGKVAVITGGASGIGWELAVRFAAEGARIVLADVERSALDDATARLSAEGHDVVGFRCDVRHREEVDALATAAVETFGGVDVLCNNAGVGGGGFLDAIPEATWRWILEVNLWGVINGVRAFLPLLLERGDGHVVNTASILGLVPAPMSAPYAVSKAGVIALSESLRHELTMRASPIGVTVVCPGWVATKIHDAERNRPHEHAVSEDDDPGAAMGREMMRGVIEAGLAPGLVAERTLAAIKAKRFWVVLPEANTDLVEGRMRNLLAGEPPPFAMPA